MIILIIIGLAWWAMLVLLAADNGIGCAALLVGWRRVCAAIVGGVLVQTLLLPMLPGLLFALAINSLRGSGDSLASQTNMLAANTLIYGHIIYYLLGRAHRRRVAAHAP